MSVPIKLLREPLLHFVFAGALLFGAYAWLNPPTPNQGGDRPVRIGEGEILWLRQTFTNQWRREPTPDEMAGLIATLVDEELMAREAHALGLDQNDTIVRRRLAQKIDFMVADTASIVDPDEAELRGYYFAHAKRYRTAATISFSHIYFSRERRRDAETDATEALRRAAGNPAIRPTDGDQLLLDDSYRDLDRHAVESLFGSAFAQAVFALPAGAWRGPVNSGFGVHLVCVTDMRPAQQKSFDEVRATVVSEWLRDKSRAIRADYLERLRAKYGVVIDAGARQAAP
jgi:hypothetical protein